MISGSDILLYWLFAERASKGLFLEHGVNFNGLKAALTYSMIILADKARLVFISSIVPILTDRAVHNWRFLYELNVSRNSSLLTRSSTASHSIMKK